MLLGLPSHPIVTVIVVVGVVVCRLFVAVDRSDEVRSLAVHGLFKHHFDWLIGLGMLGKHDHFFELCSLFPVQRGMYHVEALGR